VYVHVQAVAEALNERDRAALDARETGACTDVAEALGYVEHVEPLLLEELDHVPAILIRVTR
jgi:hypothetical protein